MSPKLRKNYKNFVFRGRPVIRISMETQNVLARAVDVIIARAKRIYILIIKVNKLFSSFSSRYFLKEIENMYSVFLSSYRNTRECFGELEKTVETLVCRSCSHSISLSPKVSNKVHVFYFLCCSSLFVLIGLEKPP